MIFIFSKGNSSLDCCFCCMSFLLPVCYSVCRLLPRGRFLLLPALSVPCPVILWSSSLPPQTPQSRTRRYIDSLGLAHYGDSENVTFHHRSWFVSLVHILAARLSFLRFSYSHCPTMGIGKFQGCFFSLHL